MDKWRLRIFFMELILLGYQYPGTIGNPVGNLIRKMCLFQDDFLSKIVGDYTGNSHEFRLNDAGLKLYWRVVKCRESDISEGFRCYIGGDQAKDYPEFVRFGKLIIKNFGYDGR